MATPRKAIPADPVAAEAIYHVYEPWEGAGFGYLNMPEIPLDKITPQDVKYLVRTYSKRGDIWVPGKHTLTSRLSREDIDFYQRHIDVLRAGKIEEGKRVGVLDIESTGTKRAFRTLRNYFGGAQIHEIGVVNYSNPEEVLFHAANIHSKHRAMAVTRAGEAMEEPDGIRMSVPGLVKGAEESDIRYAMRGLLHSTKDVDVLMGHNIGYVVGRRSGGFDLPHIIDTMRRTGLDNDPEYADMFQHFLKLAGSAVDTQILASIRHQRALVHPVFDAMRQAGRIFRLGPRSQMNLWALLGLGENPLHEALADVRTTAALGHRVIEGGGEVIDLPTSLIEEVGVRHAETPGSFLDINARPGVSKLQQGIYERRVAGYGPAEREFEEALGTAYPKVSSVHRAEYTGVWRGPREGWRPKELLDPAELAWVKGEGAGFGVGRFRGEFYNRSAKRYAKARAFGFGEKGKEASWGVGISPELLERVGLLEPEKTQLVVNRLRRGGGLGIEGGPAGGPGSGVSLELPVNDVDDVIERLRVLRAKEIDASEWDEIARRLRQQMEDRGRASISVGAAQSRKLARLLKNTVEDVINPENEIAAPLRTLYMGYRGIIGRFAGADLGPADRAEEVLSRMRGVGKAEAEAFVTGVTKPATAREVEAATNFAKRYAQADRLMKPAGRFIQEYGRRYGLIFVGALAAGGALHHRRKNKEENTREAMAFSRGTTASPQQVQFSEATRDPLAIADLPFILNYSKIRHYNMDPHKDRRLFVAS